MPVGQKFGGRKKGSLNKVTGKLKDAILEAGRLAGGEDGLVGYLTTLAKAEPVAFAGLLGKVLPLTLAGDSDNPVETITTIELIAPGLTR